MSGRNSIRAAIRKTPYHMKSIIPFIAISTLFLTGCDKEKAAVNASNSADKEALDKRKDAVDAAAKDAQKQNVEDAAVTKANIEANKDSIKAQLDAEKDKSDAAARAEKARIDAERK